MVDRLGLTLHQGCVRIEQVDAKKYMFFDFIEGLLATLMPRACSFNQLKRQW